MALTPYDWNQSIQARSEYIEERLREGSPVVALSVPDGILMLSVHRAHRKVFEIYDRLIFAGLGNQSDIEAMRAAAIDFAHREGYLRSPDDVTAQRLVGSVLSPALKRAFGDPFTAPFVFRGLFAELGEEPGEDVFFTLGYDGEFRQEGNFSAIAGSLEAENRMVEWLAERAADARERGPAIRLALEAWGIGRRHARLAAPSAVRASGRRLDAEEEESHLPPLETLLKEEIAAGSVEVGWLDRRTPRESKFRLLRREEIEPELALYR